MKLLGLPSRMLLCALVAVQIAALKSVDMSDRLFPLIGLPFRGVHGIEHVIAVIDIIDGPDDHP
jgi:hypothetical protein